MNQEEIDKLQQELAEYKSKANDKNDKVLSLLTQGKAIGSKPTIFELGDIEIRTLSYIPKQLRTKLYKVYNKYKDGQDETPEAYDEVINIYAEFMAEMCIDEELKNKDVWLKFDEECGMLYYIVNIVNKELSVDEKDMSNFRKK